MQDPADLFHIADCYANLIPCYDFGNISARLRALPDLQLIFPHPALKTVHIQIGYVNPVNKGAFDEVLFIITVSHAKQDHNTTKHD